ncbi:hypothetical protein EKD04_009680 [Chloroflexales bacterium ZM16-3]|nr:hypothetical protein [Chloroflexales bacterium ZM16-3]
MFGYPKRQVVTRHVGPNVPLFDPSGDSRCSGWWRADRGIGLNASYGMVNSWTSMLQDGKVLLPVSDALPGYVADQTNGFPSIAFGYGVTGFHVPGLLHTGDTNAAVTFVSKCPYFTGSSTFFTVSALAIPNVAMGIIDNYSGCLALWGNNASTYNNGWRMWAKPAVITWRIGPISETNPLCKQRVAFNGSAVLDWNAGQAFAPTESALLSVMNWVQYATYLHEVIVHRGEISDVEVATMHMALGQQYGLGV